MKDTLINTPKDKSIDRSITAQEQISTSTLSADPSESRVDLSEIQTIQNTVMDWIMTCVIGWNLCPFAAKSVTENRVRIQVLNDAQPIELLSTIHQASTHMLVHEQWLNTLIVTPNHWQDFYDFWDILAQVEDYVSQQGWEGKIQVASFHPQYQFEGEIGASIFSNRSPYPIFHLLHEAEVSHVINQYPHAEDIAVKNVQRLQHMGLAHIKKVFTQHQWTHALIDDKHQ